MPAKISEGLDGGTAAAGRPLPICVALRSWGLMFLMMWQIMGALKALACRSGARYLSGR